MRAVIACLFVLVFGSGLVLAEDKPAPRAPQGKTPQAKAPKRQAAPGVRWQGDLAQGLATAAAAGRPILFAINALEDERANIRLATSDYRSAAWGTATRNYVAFVCNPNDHSGPDGMCTRYVGIRCTDHQAALTHVGKQYSRGALISPQHIILEPGQRIAFRKEYYTGVVGPALLDKWLSVIAPTLAFAQAGIVREQLIQELVALKSIDRVPRLRTVASSSDPFAASVAVHVLDEVRPEGTEAATLIEALIKANTSQAGVVEMMSEDAIAFPDDAPEAAVAWIRVLRALKPAWGARAAARAIVRSDDAGIRTRLLTAWGLGGTVDAMRPPDRWLAWEALALAGDERGNARAATMPSDPVWTARLIRALHAGGHATGMQSVDLAAALAQDEQPVLRRALLSATAVQIKAHQEALEGLLRDNRLLGVRAAVAVALLRAGIETNDQSVVRTLQATLFDAIEGPDVRTAVREVLGEDPGTDINEWTRLVRARTAASK